MAPVSVRPPVLCFRHWQVMNYGWDQRMRLDSNLNLNNNWWSLKGPFKRAGLTQPGPEFPFRKTLLLWATHLFLSLPYISSFPRSNSLAAAWPTVAGTVRRRRRTGVNGIFNGISIFIDGFNFFPLRSGALFLSGFWSPSSIRSIGRISICSHIQFEFIFQTSCLSLFLTCIFVYRKKFALRDNG